MTNLSQGERAVWTDAYTLHEKYKNAETAEDWCSFGNEVVLMTAKYKTDSSLYQLAICLSQTVYNYLDAESSRRMEALDGHKTD